MFPLNRTIAVWPGYVAAAYDLPPGLALALIDRALARDPFAADLVTARLRVHLAAGDHAGATATFARLKRLAPRSALVRSVCARAPECRVRFVPNE